MKKILVIVLLLSTLVGFSQQDNTDANTPKTIRKTKEQRDKEKAQKAPITSYKIITLGRKDTTIVDTSLTIKSLYKYNYLHKDLFGKIAFSNEGLAYNTLDFGLSKFNAFAQFGHNSKNDAYLDVKDINYYSVPTPLTELYFKTVMQQGQNVDAFVTVNTSKQFNFSVAYKGLRSLGKYINQLTSTGNFRITSSYSTTNKRYNANFHYTGQDLLNNENGGITTPSDFESNQSQYKNRARLQVFLTDSKSFLKGRRFFLDHNFRLNTANTQNNIIIKHQFNHEFKFYEFNQKTLKSSSGTNTSLYRFGTASSSTSDLKDQNRFSKLYNRLAAAYQNKTLGTVEFFAENVTTNYFYNDQSQKFINAVQTPNSLKTTITTIGGQYEYAKNNIWGKVMLSNSISTQASRNLEAFINYKINNKNNIEITYQNISKQPDNMTLMHQSEYVLYNWVNNFKNEKINNLTAKINTQWAEASLQLTSLNDFIYYSNNSTSYNEQFITPKQTNSSIQYIAAKIAKEIKYKKWALDNTILYQTTQQKQNTINVPQFVTRNTLYFSDHIFKKAMFLQTGITCNFFTKYYANDYNPVLSEFFVQEKTKIGNFPMLDFFVNARIKQCRIFVIAEHFNSGFSTHNYYAAPGNPYRDFAIRFGLTWNFFQ